MSKKLNVVLSDQDYAVLTELATRQSRSVSDLVRDVLRVGVWYQKEVAPTGSRLSVKSPEGAEREVVLV